MKKRYFIIGVLISVILVSFFVPVNRVQSQTMGSYCYVPPFLQNSIKPNLLLMIDNSASMYDLAYVDKGKTDAPARTPYYCYDQTYISTNSYEGYFDRLNTDGSILIYSYNLTNDYFEPATSAFPASCTKRVANTLCIDISGAGAITKFMASGNYLNWLSASKFDVQKKILTGGKYDTSSQFLVSESRGCAGRRFAKEALTADYVEGGVNTSLAISFGVRGPANAIPTLPSSGGQTYIDVYNGNYNEAICQTAINDFVNDVGLGTLKADIKSCLDYPTGASKEAKEGVLFNQSVQACWALSNGTALGTDEINTVQNQCPDVYEEYAGGPDGIVPENPAYLCSSAYTGACCNWDAAAEECSWTKAYNGNTGDACILERHNAFCGQLEVPPVTDPTDAPSDTGTYDNLPALLGDTGLVAQLAPSIRTLTVRIMKTTAPTGIIQQYQNSIRIGAMAFNDYGTASECYSVTNNGSDIPCVSGTNLNGGKIISYVGDAVGDHSTGSGLINTIDNVVARTWTPHAEAFYNAIGYFANRTDLRLNAADFDSSKNPIQYSCQRNNILFITDGMSTADRNTTVNTLVSSYNDGDGQTGYDTVNSCPKYWGSRNLDDVAWLAKHRNIKNFSSETGNTSEFITTYAVLNGTTNNDTGECNAQTLLQGTATNGGTTLYTAENASALSTALQSAFSDILQKASSGTTVVSLPPTQSRESYIIAQAYLYPQKQEGAVALKWIGFLRLLWADLVGNIRENTDTAGETSILKYFNVILDKIITFVFSTTNQVYVANVYDDADGDGAPDSCTSTEKNTDSITPIWNASSLLKTRDPSGRNIKIWTDADGNGSVASFGEFVSFDTDLADSVKATLGSSWSYSDLGTCTVASNCVDSVIKYIMGYDMPSPSVSGSSFRLRQGSSTDSNYTQTWKLGDVIFSTPKLSPNRGINGYNTRYRDATYTSFVNDTIKNKVPVAIMGANDGMVHAFRVGSLEDISPADTTAGGKRTAKLTSAASTTLGQEEWAYIPRNAIPYLRWYCQDDYCHIPTADSTFTIIDASINGADDSTKAASSWRRLLIGTMGFGGSAITMGGTTYSSSIFVMDITDPLDPSLLWEKSLPDNTLTSGTPGIVRLGASDKNGTWTIVIGSGPSTITSAALTYPSVPKIFVFNLKDGSQAVSGGLSISGAANVAVGDFMAADLDNDYQTDDLYFGTYNSTQGKMYRLRIKSGETYLAAANWSVSTAVDAGRPVFASPTMSIDPKNNIWLYFGTGLYVTSDHVTETDEYIYGFKESEACWKTGTDCTAYSNFSDTTNTTFTGAAVTQVSCLCPGGITFETKSCTGDSCSCTSSTMAVLATTGASLSGAPTGASACNSKTEADAITCLECFINTGKIDCSTGGTAKEGWKQTISNAKIYATPLVAGGIVASTLFTPSDDPCEAGGTTGLMSLNYTTGTPFYQPTIITETGTSVVGATRTISKRVSIGYGAPPFKQSLVPVATGDTFKVFTQASGGIAGLNIKPSVSYMANGFIQWLSR